MDALDNGILLLSLLHVLVLNASRASHFDLRFWVGFGGAFFLGLFFFNCCHTVFLGEKLFFIIEHMSTFSLAVFLFYFRNTRDYSDTTVIFIVMSQKSLSHTLHQKLIYARTKFII